jgi:hypothetical protein
MSPTIDDRVQMLAGLAIAGRRTRPRRSFHAQARPNLSNNIIQKGLAFVREQSGSVLLPGARRASGSCPAGCMAEVGLWRWRR